MNAPNPLADTTNWGSVFEGASAPSCCARSADQSRCRCGRQCRPGCWCFTASGECRRQAAHNAAVNGANPTDQAVAAGRAALDADPNATQQQADAIAAAVLNAAGISPGAADQPTSASRRIDAPA